MNENYLSDRDLLGLIVTDAAASDLLSRFRTLEELLVHASEEELSAATAVGPKRAAQLKAIAELAHRLYHRSLRSTPVIIRKPADVFELCKDLQFQKQEEARALLLNTKNHVIDIITVSLGCHDHALLQPHQIFPAAMKRNSVSLILVHCHPSGDPTPSPEDAQVTRKLQTVGETLGITLLDHIVIGKGAYVSLKEQGLM